LQREPVTAAVVRLNEDPNGVAAKFCGESATRCTVAALKAVADHAGTTTLIAARHWRTLWECGGGIERMLCMHGSDMETIHIVQYAIPRFTRDGEAPWWRVWNVLQ
jgi:hypothetical protein